MYLLQSLLIFNIFVYDVVTVALTYLHHYMQIDDLVAEVFKQRVNNKMGKKEIEHFTIVLSEMHSSLKVDPQLDSSLE